MPPKLLTSAALCLLLTGSTLAQPQRSSAELRWQILSAEDRRAPTDADLSRLTSALDYPDSSIQRAAVRALGRLERPALVAVIGRMLASPDAGVRAEAANALAQAVAAVGEAPARANAPAKNSPVAEVESLLQKQLEREEEATVRGVLCESLGRLPYSNAATLQTVEKLLVAATSAQPTTSGTALQDPPFKRWCAQ